MKALKIGRRTTRKQALAGAWYDERRDIHQRFAKKLTNILEELLIAKGIQFDRVEARVKSRTSFLGKAAKKVGRRPKYRSPSQEIKDLVGVRVVTYLESAVAEVAALFEAEFQVDRNHSLDKGQALGADRIGYRAKHYVAQLGDRRSGLTECQEFSGISFELQVRSLLQHAWAEIEHDRRFKYPGQLSRDIQREFNLLAGSLEQADQRFNALARQVEELAAKTAQAASGGEADRDLTDVVAAEYLRGVLAEAIAAGRVDPSLGDQETRLDELSRFGAKTLRALAELVPKDFLTRFPGVLGAGTTFADILRNAMILADANRYFAQIPLGDGFILLSPEQEALFRSHGVDMDQLVNEGRFLRMEDLDVDGDGMEDPTECGFCGEEFPFETLQAVGAGGQEAPLACPHCMKGMDEDHRAERASYPLSKE